MLGEEASLGVLRLLDCVSCLLSLLDSIEILFWVY